MKRHTLLSILILFSLALVVLPTETAAQESATPSPGRAVDKSAPPAGDLSPAPAPQAAAVDQWGWQYGPPSTFEYQRFDGVFVPGPAEEPWANKVYFMGGRISAPSELPDVWMFDPLTGDYTDTGADMIEDVSNYNADLVVDDGTGRGPAIYVVGGYDKDGGGGSLGLVQRYYPQTGAVESLPPGDNWPGQVGGSTVAGMGSAVVDDLIYVFGGWSSSTSPYFYAGTWVLDPRQPSGSRWTDLGVGLDPGRSYIQTAVQDGKIYALGGISGYVSGDLIPTDVVEVLDTNDLAAGWQTLSPMPVPTAEGRGFGFDSDTLGLDQVAGRIYVVGGGDWPDISREVLEYDVASDTWNQDFPELNDRRVNLAGAYVPLYTPDPGDGLPGMWVFGGRSENGCDPPYGATEYYSLLPETCHLLLVDDDWDFDQVVPNDGGRPYYTSTLDYLGYSYDLWDTVSLSTPTAADLAPYDVVIWFTGYDWQTPISPTEEAELVAYLNDGGNLLVSSQEQAYAFPGSSIMTDYFWVDVITQDVALTGTLGSPGDPLFAGLGPYPMSRPDQWAAYWPTGGDEGPWDDEVRVKPGGFEPLVYADNGHPNSTRYLSDTFKTLYLAFPLEWLPNLNQRAEVMDVALHDWFGCTPPCVGLSGATVAGPTQLLPDETGTYSVTQAPAHATPPIDVVWSNGMTETVALYSWSEPGTYTVGVTLTNCYDTAVVTDRLQVEVLCVGLESATITGPQQLLLGQSGTFSVGLTPPTATTPIDVLWSNGETGPSALYSWDQPGFYTVVVTATNCDGGAVVTASLPVEVVCTGLTDVSVDGPAQLLPGETGVYSATLAPPEATPPIDLWWSNGAISPSTAYSWTEPGFYTIAVTGTNCAGNVLVTDTFDVQVLCIELNGVTITGALIGPPGVYTFGASYDPPDATGPISYTWDNGNTSAQSTRAYTQAGAYDLSLTALNPCSQVTDEHTITIVEADIELIPPGPAEPVLPGTTYTDSLTVRNAGGYSLTWSLSQTAAWLDVAPTEGELAPGASQEVSLSFDASGLSPDTYTSTLLVTSNDPDEPTLSLVVTMTVYEEPCVGLTDVTISGESNGPPGVYTFTSAYQPVSATEPIDYLWDDGDTTSFSARTLDAGAYTLTLRASNCASVVVTATHTILIQAAPVCTPVTGVELSRLTTDTIYVDDLVGLRADVTPLDASPPYTYLVYADGTVVVPQSSGAAPISFDLSFGSAGTHTAQIDVWNCDLSQSQAVTSRLDLVVMAPEISYRVYLPVVFKGN